MLLDGVASLPLNLIIAGCIWAVALGFAAGNYACSVVHRLPRGRGVLEKKPYCGSCGTMLATKDLFPVISALLLRHKCRYCGAAIPKSHFWTEILIGVLFMLAFLKFNYSEQFILIVFLGTFWVVLASIENNEGYLQGRVLVAVAVAAMLFRVLQDGTIYGFFEGGLFGMIAGLIVWHKRVEKVGHRYNFPDGAQLMTLGGLCAGASGLPLFFVAFAGFWFVLWGVARITREGKPYALSIPFGFAAMLSVLYPDLTLSGVTP